MAFGGFQGRRQAQELPLLLRISADFCHSAIHGGAAGDGNVCRVFQAKIHDFALGFMAHKSGLGLGWRAVPL